MTAKIWHKKHHHGIIIIIIIIIININIIMASSSAGDHLSYLVEDRMGYIIKLYLLKKKMR